jgi:hypothetical protein
MKLNSRDFVDIRFVVGGAEMKVWYVEIGGERLVGGS